MLKKDLESHGFELFEEEKFHLKYKKTYEPEAFKNSFLYVPINYKIRRKLISRGKEIDVFVEVYKKSEDVRRAYVFDPVTCILNFNLLEHEFGRTKTYHFDWKQKFEEVKKQEPLLKQELHGLKLKNMIHKSSFVEVAVKKNENELENGFQTLAAINIMRYEKESFAFDVMITKEGTFSIIRIEDHELNGMGECERFSEALGAVEEEIKKRRLELLFVQKEA